MSNTSLLYKKIHFEKINYDKFVFHVEFELCQIHEDQNDMRPVILSYDANNECNR
jgi:hypothetical protein